MIPLRAFIAVEIPADLQLNVYGATSNLRNWTGSLIRWVPADNMHLTLKFLGDILPANLEHLTQMLQAEAESCHCFDIELTGLGSFPTSKRPRIIYVGFQTPAELGALQQRVESAARRLGYQPESRSFSPHLTIGRVKQNVSASDHQKIGRAVKETKIDSLGIARVDSIHLYKSDLKPTGSVYTRLFSAQFKNAR